MTELKIRPLPVLGPHESFVPIDDEPFIDESVVRQMILDGEPDDLPATGNPSLPQSQQRTVPTHPLAFAS
ncbi:MAG: hypothetical protein R3242_06855 [Akkermansiaceae bacterium]|nr:hypothetical protein [Akkermansiaceae bacterium]